MNKDRVIGIYKILCTENNEFYIGSSLNIDERIYQHRCDLKLNRHHSVYMQRCYNRYGPEKFKFDIIAEFKECTEDLLREIEYLYIVTLKPTFNYAAPVTTTKRNEEWRQKISESTKKLYTEKGYINPRLGVGKRYDVYNIMGDKIAEHKTICEATSLAGVVSYHSLNNGIRNEGFATTRTGYAIVEEGKDLYSLILNRKYMLHNTVSLIDTDGNLYKQPSNTYYRKGKKGPNGYKSISYRDIRDEVLKSKQKYYIIDDKIFTLPFLGRFIEQSILKNT